jgi:uncharacterized protein
MWDGDKLHVYVTSRPIEGEANRAVVKAVANALGVRASAVTLVGGARGRHKLIEVRGLDSVPTRFGSGPPG